MKHSTLYRSLFAATALTMSICAASAQEITIGVALQSLAVPYATALNEGVQKAAKDLGVKTVEVDANHDLLTQANHIDQFIARAVSGIIMDPADSQSAMDWADKAESAGIPMVSMGVWVGNPAKDGPPNVYPALLALADRNDIDQSYALGKAAVARYPNGGKIAVVEGLPGFAAVEFRNRGFMKALKDSGVDYEIVLQNPGNWDPQQGYSLCQNAVQANPDLIFVFAHDQGMGRGCYEALTAAGSEAYIYTVDYSDETKQVMADGAPITTVCSLPYDSGYAAMTTLVEFIRSGTEPENPYLTYEWDLITADNLEDCPVQF